MVTFKVMLPLSSGFKILLIFNFSFHITILHTIYSSFFVSLREGWGGLFNIFSLKGGANLKGDVYMKGALIQAFRVLEANFC